MSLHVCNPSLSLLLIGIRTLYNSYTLYVQNNADGWDEKNIKALANFSTIDEFWGMY